MSGCRCQQFAKSGVPHLVSWRCLVCGGLVTPDGPFVCPQYLPAADGVCQTCEDEAPAHTFAARALGEGLPAGVTEDRCHLCGTLIGVGAPALHVGVCEPCTRYAARPV